MIVSKRIALGIVAIFMIMCAGSLQALGVDFTFNGVRLNSGLLGGVPLPSGADVGIDIPIDDALDLTFRLAGGFEDRMLLRTDSSGVPVPKPDYFDAGHWFFWPNVEADIGALYRSDLVFAGKPVLLFGMLRARYENNMTSLDTTVFSDAKGLMALSLLAGAGIDAVDKHPNRSRSGYGIEFSVEYSPSIADFSGGTDFARLSGFFEGYIPLGIWGATDLGAVSLYAAGYVAGDAAWGGSIPLYVLTSFGGRDLRSGLGSSIRGYRSWGYEAAAKAEANLELRLVGPGLFGQAGLRPLAYVFADAGAFDRLAVTAGQDSGFLASAGGGAALGLFDFAYVGARAGYKFPGHDPLDATYFPAGQRFFWNITFLLHF